MPALNLCATDGDWCDGDNITFDARVIKVGDFTAPSVTAGRDCDWDGGLGPLVFFYQPLCTAAFSITRCRRLRTTHSSYRVKTGFVASDGAGGQPIRHRYRHRIDTVLVRLIAWNAPSAW